MEPEDRRPPKKAEGRSMPVPEPGAVLLPGYRVQLQLGADLLPLCRAVSSLVAAFRALGADPTEVKREAEKGYRRSGQGTAWPATWRGPLFPLGIFPPDRRQILSPPPRPTGKISPTAICS